MPLCKAYRRNGKRQVPALLLLLPVLLLNVSPAHAQKTKQQTPALSEAADRPAEGKAPALSPKAALRMELLHPQLLRPQLLRPASVLEAPRRVDRAAGAPFALNAEAEGSGSRGTWLVVGGVAALGVTAAAVLLLGGGGGEGSGGSGEGGEVGIPLPPGRP